MQQSPDKNASTSKALRKKHKASSAALPKTAGFSSTLIASGSGGPRKSKILAKINQQAKKSMTQEEMDEFIESLGDFEDASLIELWDIHIQSMEKMHFYMGISIDAEDSMKKIMARVLQTDNVEENSNEDSEEEEEEEEEVEDN